MATGDIVGMKVRRAKLLEHFANRARFPVAMEACGGAHHWARELVALGHEVKLLPPKAVRPFVACNKNDSRDEHGIWTAVQQPGVKEVEVKSEEQQAVLTLNRMGVDLELVLRVSCKRSISMDL